MMLMKMTLGGNQTQILRLVMINFLIYEVMVAPVSPSTLLKEVLLAGKGILQQSRDIDGYAVTQHLEGTVHRLICATTKTLSKEGCYFMSSFILCSLFLYFLCTSAAHYTSCLTFRV